MAATLPRITARVDKETQSLLTQASALVGISNLSSFVLNAAVEKAKEIMAHEQNLDLSRRDAVMLVAALDEAPRKHARLQQAARRYEGQTEAL